MTEKLTRINLHGRRTSASSSISTIMLAGLVLFAAAAGSSALAQAPQTNFPTPGGTFAPASNLSLPPLPVRPAITPNGTVIEDVIARINDQIITRSEYEAAEQQLLQEAHQNNLSEADLEDHLHDLLRDMIDEQLLLSKGKELGITGDAETMRQLDDIRKKNNLASMEDLQKAAAQQGVSFEDFKQHIRDQIIRQQVVQQEVGRTIRMTHADEQAYYTAHAQEFVVPEQVHLSEILIPTPENATDAQISDAQAKADALEAKLKSGTAFADLARTSSGGPTAAAGGDLGDFKRGALGSDILENATFSLPAGGNTAPIRTRQGFVILHVDSHQAAGVPPISTVEDKIQNALYFEQLQPALRTYLTKARADAYLVTAPGFIDTGSAKKATAPTDIAYTAYKAPPLKKKVQAKQHAEQVRAEKAQADLAAARARVAEKEAAKAEAAQSKNGGAKDVSKPYKPKKTRREKIRYGQAPERALPTGPVQTAEATAPSAPIGGQAPGAAMAPTDSVTSITTGTGADDDADPLAAKDAPHKKVRFSSQESAAEEASAKVKLAKAEVKATTRPTPATPTESATEKYQATPLGLNGDTTKKPKKDKRKKGEVKERMQDQTKPVDTSTPVAPTVNPTLGTPSAPPAAPASTTPPQ